jgi:NADH dehydrogenase FAD-containing subunit
MRGLVAVNNRLQAKPNVYVLGDNAAAPYGGLAFSAVMNANFVAKDIKATHQRQSKA